MTKEERKRLAAHHAVAPLNVQPVRTDQPEPEPPKAAEDRDDPPTRFSNASHHS